MKNKRKIIGFIFGLISNFVISTTGILAVVNLIFEITSNPLIDWVYIVISALTGVFFFIVALILMFKE